MKAPPVLGPSAYFDFGGIVITIGLTGGFGSGKSAVAEMLAAKGATVIHADQVGHEAYRKGTDEYLQLVATFGPEVIGEDGEIDRRRLGQMVFEDPQARHRLEAIVWPAMRRLMERRLAELETAGTRMAVLEAALLVEADWLPLVDEVWLVEVPLEVARQRLIQDRGFTADQAQARLDAQLSDQERRRHADVVIDNGGSLDETRRQVDRLWAKLKERAAVAAPRRSTGSS